MSSLVGFWSDRCLDHQAPEGEFEAPWTGRLAQPEPHPDRPERLKNVRSALESEYAVDWRDARPASRTALESVHDADYLDDIEAWSAVGGGRLTPTTGGNEATWDAARHAAGAAMQAAEYALDENSAAYAACRPSGHHAQPAQADGFCFVCNAAVAALAALNGETVERVAVVDWDVHHGNGTQECLYDRDDVLFVDIHNDHGAWSAETHPQTGGVDETGAGMGDGYTVNVPLPAGTGNDGYASVFEEIVEPTVSRFDPDLVVASAGGDASVVDPLGRNLLTTAGFADLGRRIRALADTHAGGSLAVLQEGGYQVSHLGYAMLATVQGIRGDDPVDDPFGWLPERTDSTVRAVEDIRDDLRAVGVIE